MVTTLVSARVSVARTLAEVLLQELEDRWRHTVGVARRAEELSVTTDPEDRTITRAR